MAKRNTFVVRIPVEQSHAKRFKPLADLFLGIGVVCCHPKVAVPFAIERDAILAKANDGTGFNAGHGALAASAFQSFSTSSSPGWAPSDRPIAKISSVPGGPFKLLALPAAG